MAMQLNKSNKNFAKIYEVIFDIYKEKKGY